MPPLTTVSAGLARMRVVCLVAPDLVRTRTIPASGARFLMALQPSSALCCVVVNCKTSRRYCQSPCLNNYDFVPGNCPLMSFQFQPVMSNERALLTGPLFIEKNSFSLTFDIFLPGSIGFPGTSFLENLRLCIKYWED